MEKKQLKNNKENELKLIPKVQDYIKYMINVIIKLPRVEKFSIGTEYKNSMYKMLNSILYVSKIEIIERFYHVNFIDAELNCQRIFLRIMKDNHWLDEKKLNYDNLMKAHKLSRKGKGYRDEVILFNLKQEEYIMWLYDSLKNMTYKHRRLYCVLYI